MSAIIVWLAESALGKAILQIVWNDLSGWLIALIAKHKQVLLNKARAAASVAPLKKAQTGKEISDATDSSLNGL